MNDGSYIAPLNSFKKHQQRLRNINNELAVKSNLVNNWKKEKTKVQKIHIDIANARKDFLHKITTTISKNHALVCVEDLQVSNMSKSASGTKEKPGKNVRQKSGLKSKHPRSRLGDVSQPVGVQTGMERRNATRCASAIIPAENVPLRSYCKRQPQDTGPIRVC